MNFPPFLLAIFTLTVLAPSAASGWGDDGHNAIWKLAQERLTPEAKAKVEAILAGDKVEMTAVWMDRARDVAKKKGGPLKNDAEAKDFNTRFPENATWHYIDMPMGQPSYAATKAFHDKENIVTQIGMTMGVLAGRVNGMDKRTALRVLVHLVGDIHQPLHCASGYFDISNPERAVLHTDMDGAYKLFQGKSGDLGGNLLFFGPGGFDNLHGFWDVEVVNRLHVLVDLSDVLRQRIPNTKAETPGPATAWPAAWADETGMLTMKVYEGITFGKITPKKDPKKRGAFDRIDITLPENYLEFAKGAAAEQMTKAAVRMADLLNGLLR